MRILTVIGARPQFVKAAAVSAALARHGGFQEILIHTGQHFDTAMSQVFFDELGIPAPDHNLGIHGGGHGDMTGRMMVALEPVMAEARPDRVLVYGDTNSTLAATLTAVKLGLPVAHVEAGLRSFNRAMPEEVNRLVADQLSCLRFCPTRAAMDNLRAESLDAGAHLVGDVMYDATLAAVRRAERSTILERLGLRPGDYAVATLHRAENTADRGRLAALLDYLRRRANGRPLVLPLHPRTRDAVSAYGLSLDGLMVVAPLGYLDMHGLMAKAAEILTDSGGVQKEAYFHGIPCVTLRDETEWVETISHGWNRLWKVEAYTPRRPIDDYGDGHAADQIARLLGQG